MAYKNALSELAGKKTTYDISGAIGDKVKKGFEWQEFADWINGKDAQGGEEAQKQLAQVRAKKLMNQMGPDPMKRLSGVRRSSPAKNKPTPSRGPGVRANSPAAASGSSASGPAGSGLQKLFR